MSNDFVGMDCCIHCNQPKGILIHQRCKPIPQHAHTSPEPCDECKKKFEEQNIVPVHEIEIINKVGKLTSRYTFIRRDCVNEESLIKMMNEVGFLFAESSEFKKIISQNNEYTN